MTENMEKRSKHKFNKDRKNEDSAVGKDEPQNVGKMKAIEDIQIAENEAIDETQRHHKRDKVKKKDKGTKDNISSMEPYADGEGDKSDAISKAEKKKRKKQKKKREKNDDKDGVFEGGDVKEVKSKNWSEGDAVSMMPSSREPRKDMKKRKAIIERHTEKEEVKGENVMGHIEKCQVDDGEMVKRKKRKRDTNNGDGESMPELVTSKGLASNRVVVDDENSRKDLLEKVSSHEEDFGKKTEKKKKKRRNNESGEAVLSSLHKEDLPENGSNEILDGDIQHSEKGKEEEEEKKKKKTTTTKLVENRTDGIWDDGLYTNKEKNKNCVQEENNSDYIQDDGLKSLTKGMKKKKKSAEDGSNGQTPNKSNKKVRFSGQDEVFPLPVDLNAEKQNDDEDNLVRGKRFTRKEDEIVKEAVEKYIEEHDLGEEGMHMVLNSSKYPELRGCWREIGSAIPYRPYSAIYYRAQVLFRRSASRKWTQEECEEVLKYQEEFGNKWKELADELGKHRWHVKDTWRRIKLANQNKGCWSQKEYQNLFDLVNTDLQLRVFEEKKSKHGMLRDNIAWTAISDKLSTRSQANCCLKWYKQLTSPMVSEGLWADIDDYRLLDALYSLDATCMEDVDWDNLLDNRSGDVCRKRWTQMVQHIGEHGNKSFAEQVEVLALRYCPHLIEAREAWDSKPRVP